MASNDSKASPSPILDGGNTDKITRAELVKELGGGEGSIFFVVDCTDNPPPKMQVSKPPPKHSVHQTKFPVRPPVSAPPATPSAPGGTHWWMSKKRQQKMREEQEEREKALKQGQGEAYERELGKQMFEISAEMGTLTPVVSKEIKKLITNNVIPVPLTCPGCHTTPDFVFNRNLDGFALSCPFCGITGPACKKFKDTVENWNGLRHIWKNG